VLVGRDDLLALAERRLDEVAGGRGQLLFVAGEAGIGKTRLLAAVTEAARRRGFGVIRAAAFPGDTETSGGLLLELASDLRQPRDPRLHELGELLSARLRGHAAEADRLLATAGAGREADPWYPLTARELEVARLVAAGGTNREIAARLFLSPKTVAAHVEHILTKLGAARRTEIAAWVAALPAPGPRARGG
jgi:DNA-binding CsgD family transcriptional regulator